MRRQRSKRRKKSEPLKVPVPPFEFKFNIEEILGMFFERFDRESTPNVQIVECSIPSEMFRKLMMLCHPDKHGNSELSQEVTRWLLDQREKRKTKETDAL